MPNRGFLEQYPLYRKFRVSFERFRKQPGGFWGGVARSSTYADSALPKPAINMHCGICGSPQTFNMQNSYESGFERGVLANMYSSASAGRPEVLVARLIYRCSLCRKFVRHFVIKLDVANDYIMKVGQEPPWDITLNPALDRALGARASLYQKALICESQSYGIGAFAYYRRIVEEIIDDLLEDIPNLMAGEERDRYLEALEQVRDTKATQKKIELVKDELPPILRPGGMNPLSTLHDTLSEGLHRQSDERCMELAGEVKAALVFLVNQIEITKATSGEYVESMRRLQERNREAET